MSIIHLLHTPLDFGLGGADKNRYGDVKIFVQKPVHFSHYAETAIAEVMQTFFIIEEENIERYMNLVNLVPTVFEVNEVTIESFKDKKKKNNSISEF